MLECGRPFQASVLYSVVIPKFCALGIRLAKGGEGKLFSDVVVEAVSPDALIDAVPHFQMKRTGVWFPPIDNAFSPRSVSATGIALAIALLFASLEEAMLRCCCEPHDDNPEPLYGWNATLTAWFRRTARCGALRMQTSAL
jgi:hypothetical protein